MKTINSGNVQRIFLDGKALSVSAGDLPMLIHGADGNGASLFSVSVIANLYAAGCKLLFTSGYHMAREEFKGQTGVGDRAVLVEKASDIEQAYAKQVIFVPKENADLFDQLVVTLPDIAERVIFLKNFDLFDESHFDVVKTKKRLVLAGDLENCSYKRDVLSKDWRSRVYFSPAENVKLPELPKYTGYLTSASRDGLVLLG